MRVVYVRPVENKQSGPRARIAGVLRSVPLSQYVLLLSLAKRRVGSLGRA